MGIYGMGEIGTAIAHRARAFGMTIAYSNRRPIPEQDATFIADPLDLIATADVLMIAAPSTPETRGFVNASTLARAKPSLILINIARGELVVDTDLIAALAGRRIFAAGLDVFAGEPDVAAGYFDLPNVVMTPHIGSSTREARAAMGQSAIRSIRAFFAGEADPARLV
jgi:lactate dehydrogenase-like 2-hydroxyacid dehydrogenase